MVKVWECGACGYEKEGGLCPRKCPNCGADADAFDYYEYDDDDYEEDDEEG